MKSLSWTQARRAGTLMAVIILSACAGALTPSLSQLFGDARRNEVRALATYRGEVMEISGVVAAVGVKPVEKLVATHRGYGWFGSTTAQRSREQYPFVSIVDPGNPAEGVLHCYFPPRMLDDVATVERGHAVTVRGQFQEFVVQSSGVAAILNRCSFR